MAAVVPIATLLATADPAKGAEVFKKCASCHNATQGGARAVQQATRLGTLEVGKKADLFVLNTQRAHLVPAGRIVSAWIHNGQPADIESVMIDGQFVMRNRKVLTIDEDAIVAEADKVGRRIWSQVKAAGPIPIPGRPQK